MTQTKYVTDVKQWYQLLLDDRLEISNTIFINENIVQVTSIKTNMFKTVFELMFILLLSQHLMQDCGCMICWTISGKLLPIMTQTVSFILIMVKNLLKQDVC